MSTVYFEHRATAADLACELAGLCRDLGPDFDAAAFDAARPIAEQSPVDCRMKGVWAVVERHSRNELLASWVRHWLGADGHAWQLGHDEAAETLQKLVPFAERVGETGLAEEAMARLAWMPIGYLSHKEYGFEQVLEWFCEASTPSPEIWQTLGWRLWCLCNTCDTQYGDNRFDYDVRTAISSAALRCGAPDWWSLVSSTLPHLTDEYWHSNTRGLLVEGVQIALRTGMQMTNADFLGMWCIAISLSMWFDSGEVASLGDLRPAMLNAVRTDDQREELAAGFLRTGRGRILEQSPRIVEEESEEADQPSASANHDTETPEPTLDALVARIAEGGYVLPSEAARAIRELDESAVPNKEELRAAVFGALGSNKGYAASWSYVDRDVAGSVHFLAGVAADDELWLAVAALAREYPDSRLVPHSLAANLDRLAIERAKVRGLSELVVGLEYHLAMHSRWAFGGGPLCQETWPALPARETQMSWQDVAIRLLTILLDSYSAEALGAALEGMHALVAVDTSVIPQLFQSLTTDWQRRWLLIAAEAWASLHPEAMPAVRDSLERAMNEGSLQERLQAWIILCKHSDMTHVARPRCPLPDEAPGHPADASTSTDRLLHIPPIQVGQRSLIGRFSGAESTLRLLRTCGWDLSSLEASIAQNLFAQAGQTDDSPQQRGPRRRGDFFCSPLDAENAISTAILSILSSDVCDEAGVVRLAQGLLDNEDAWIQSAPLMPATSTDLWPGDEYGTRDEMSDQELKRRLIEIATVHDVPAGWRVFCAHVFFYTWKKDFGPVRNIVSASRNGYSTQPFSV